MRSHSLCLLGHEVSFKAEADPKRVEEACELLEQRYLKLLQHGGSVSKEKLLVFLALALADDLLLLKREKDEGEKRIRRLLASIEKAAEYSA